MSLLIYAVIAACLTYFAFKARNNFFTLLLQFLPFVFVFSFLWMTRDQYQILQIRKVGYQFDKNTSDYRHPARAVYIGGDRENDDLFDSGMPSHAVRVTPALNEDSVAVEVLTDGVLLLRNQHPLNALALRNGDQIEIAGQKLVFHSRGSFGRSLSYGEKVWEWPRSVRKFGRLKEGLPADFNREYYSLSEIAKALELPIVEGAGLILQKSNISISRQPVQLNRVLLFGYGSEITVNGNRLPANFRFSSGDTLRIAAAERQDGSLGLRHTLAFIIRNEESLSFLHPLPQTLAVKEELLRVSSVQRQPLLVSTGSLPYSVFPAAIFTRESDRFKGLFAFIQVDEHPEKKGFFHQARDELLKFFSLDRKKFEVVTDSGTFRPSAGEQIALGKSERLLFRLEQIRFPWNLLQILLILMLLKMIFQAPFYLFPVHTAGLLLPIQLDFFLVTRFLFAFRAASLYPFSSETIPSALFAYLVVPYLVFSAIAYLQREERRLNAINFGLYTILVILFAGMFLRERFWLTVGICCLTSLLIVLKYRPATIPAKLKNWKDSINLLKPETYMFLFFLFAFLLQLSGAGEAVRFAGFRISLPVLYHPFLLLFASYFFYRLSRKPEGKNSREEQKSVLASYLKFLAVLAAFFALSVLLSDLGFFLVYCLPLLFILFGISIAYLSEYEIRWKVVGTAMALPLAAFVMIFTAYSTIVNILPSSYLGSRYLQRVLLSVDPSVLEESGLIATEKQLGHQRLFLAYSHSGWNGGGYMNRAISSGLSATALNDNVPSAFLLNDFGIAGLLAVVIILSGIVWLWVQSNRNQGNRFASILSLTGLITLLYADLYMILANCGIFLFTGKNVFFWGLNSISDVFQSTFLFLTILLPSLLVQPEPVAHEVRTEDSPPVLLEEAAVHG